MSIFSQVTGHGPTILLTHGFAATSRMFINTIPAIATNHTVVVWDQLGHGRSDSPDDPEQYSVAASLEAMRGLVEQAGGGPGVLLGHSLGGYLSLESLAHPDDVRALVLVDTGPGYRSDRGRAQWNEMAERYAAGLEARGLESLPDSPGAQRRSPPRGRRLGPYGSLRAAPGGRSRDRGAVFDRRAHAGRRRRARRSVPGRVRYLAEKIPAPSWPSSPAPVMSHL